MIAKCLDHNNGGLKQRRRRRQRERQKIRRFMLGHRLFFRLASNAFPDIGSIGRIEKKFFFLNH